MAELKVGQKAPEFTLPDQDGKIISLKDLKGKWVILYAYPKDDTPGCTIEGIGFTRFHSEFQKQGAVVLGISPDDGKSHCKFRDKHKLTIPLLCDPEHKALAVYGAWGMKRFFLNKYEGVIRSTFLIDPKGDLAYIWPKVSAKGHAEEALQKLKELKK